ncbi:hypothetical protein MVEG_00194, partial [Podila verticillata NRRL 6337]
MATVNCLFPGGLGTIDYLCDSSFFLSVLQVLTLGFREGYGAADRRCLVGARDEIRYTRRESGKRAKRKNDEDGKEQEKVKEQKAWRWYKRAGVGESETYAKVKRKQKGNIWRRESGQNGKVRKMSG